MKHSNLFGIILSATIILVASSCKSQKQFGKSNENQTFVFTTKKTVIYKTIRDFSQLVPVIMNADKTTITSYPAPADLLLAGKPTLPTPLHKGYWLDNRGIGEHVAFLKYTYEAYAKLKQAPSMVELMNNIAEKNPLSELYYCGESAQYPNGLSDLNTLIDKGFPNCKKANIISMQINF